VRVSAISRRLKKAVARPLAAMQYRAAIALFRREAEPELQLKETACGPPRVACRRMSSCTVECGDMF